MDRTTVLNDIINKIREWEDNSLATIDTYQAVLSSMEQNGEVFLKQAIKEHRFATTSARIAQPVRYQSFIELANTITPDMVTNEAQLILNMHLNHIQ